MAEPRKDRPLSEGRDTKGRFAAGNAGKPHGARRKVNLALDRLIASAAPDVARAAIVAAKAGDVSAMSLILGRILPPAKERPLDLGELPDSPAEAAAAIMAAAASGELLVSDAEKLMSMTKARADLASLAEIEARLAALETQLEGKSR